MSLRIGRRRPGGPPEPACRVGPGTRLVLAASLVLTATLGPAVPTRADLIIKAPNLIAGPGSSGSFDVLLVNTNAPGSASYDVAADSLGLALAGPLSVTFTDVSI